jgi:hypothetical protein
VETEFYMNIEGPIRELVHRLRDAGVNTTSSCGHEMYVQVALYPDGFLQTMHRETYNWLIEQGNGRPEYKIDIHFKVRRGIPFQCFAEIRIGDPDPIRGIEVVTEDDEEDKR